jgi:hypothetical protein
MSITPAMCKILFTCMLGALALGQGKGVKPPLRVPQWFTLYEPENEKIEEQTTERIRVSFDADASFNSVVGYYETTMRKLPSSGIRQSEQGNGHGTTFEILTSEISCKLDVGLKAKPHVELDCSRIGDLSRSHLAQSSGPDFRQVRWGMSKAQVLATESHKISTLPGGTVIGLTDTVDGRTMLISYEFVSDKLARAFYTLAEKYRDPSEYITVTRVIQAALAEKYGPGQEQTKWVNNLFQKDPNHWGTALSLGHVFLAAGWQTDRTKIQQLTSGGGEAGAGGNINIFVNYTSIEYEGALAQKRAEERRKVY